jgi:hypothetical protein
VQEDSRNSYYVLASSFKEKAPVEGDPPSAVPGLAAFSSEAGFFLQNSSSVIFLSLCTLYSQRDETHTVFFIIISALHVSGGFLRPSSGAYKTVCAALGIVMLSRCLPPVGTSSNPSTPA